MRQVYFLIGLICISLCTYAQKHSITWGEEFKLKKGSNNISVVYTDKTGVYVEENHSALKAYFVIGASLRASASLVKLDNNLNEVYKTSFNRDLKGKNFESFVGIGNKLLIIASTYHKSDRALEIFGAEINKSSGQLAGSWKSIASFQKNEKKEQIKFRMFPNADSSKIILISTITGRAKNSYRVQEFDLNLKASSKPATITNEFEPKTYQLEDVSYTVDRKIILVGRVYEYQEGKKKKGKFLDFSKYSIRIYDEKGKQLNEINTNINGKWLTSSKLLLNKQKEIVLAAFYSKVKKGKTDGLLVQRIDPATAQVISTAEKEINYSLLTDDNDELAEDEEEGKKGKKGKKERDLEKKKEENEGFSKYMQFRNIFITPDNGIVLLAEHFHHYEYMSSDYTPGTNGMPGRWTYYTNTVYECGEILMCKVDANNNISWLEVLPKAQREVIRNYSHSSSGFSIGISYFDGAARPYYAGFGAALVNNHIRIFFNDNPKNTSVLRPGQMVKRISLYRKSDCFVVTLDAGTGQYKRKLFFSNAELPTAMPRLASEVGPYMYMVGRTDRALGKTKLAVAKITWK